MPRLEVNAIASEQPTPFRFNVTASRATSTTNIAQPTPNRKVAVSRIIRGPERTPADIGFALLELSDEIAGRVVSRLVVHTVWNAEWRQAGLKPGLALVSVNGHDVKSFSAHACMHFVANLDTAAHLKVMPVSSEHHRAWSPSSPRCIGFRSSASLARQAWGLMLTAPTVTRGEVYVAGVDPVVPQVANAVDLGDVVLAINMLDTSRCSYAGLMNTIESQSDQDFVSIILCSPDQVNQDLTGPRTVTLTRVYGHAFGMVVIGSDMRPQQSSQMPGAFVSYVEPTLKDRLRVGDRILQVNGVTTARATCKAVRQLVEESPGLEVELSVKHDPAGFISLLRELEETGKDSQMVLQQTLDAAAFSERDLFPSFAAVNDGAMQTMYQWPLHRVMMTYTPRKKS
eukprot:TRINITY_DN6287_c0_g1_i1.p1 TRINITY_DN6287_c0_g1~~TRINITY_DN6287_c0_g1_i1.p1  ORF type:complete len:454 (+),score=76.82 TRINITY_DN6287_c0_g1_i1:168-1364(+)